MADHGVRGLGRRDGGDKDRLGEPKRVLQRTWQELDQAIDAVGFAVEELRAAAVVTAWRIFDAEPPGSSL